MTESGSRQARPRKHRAETRARPTAAGANAATSWTAAAGWTAAEAPAADRTDERRAAEEGEMTDEQFAFIMALNEYKAVNKRPFPTWTEVLDVIKALGYRKVAEPGPIR